MWLSELPLYRMNGGIINEADWFFRGIDDNPQVFSPRASDESGTLRLNYFPNSETTTSGGDDISACSGLNGIGQGMYAFREVKLGEIVRGEITRDNLSDEFDKKAKDYAYSTLKRVPELLDLEQSDDIVFQSFYELVMESNIGKFSTIFDRMEEHEIMEALELNSAIIAEELMDENQKIVNRLYLETYAQDIGFTDTETESLTKIATLTPYLGGDAVYSARLMLDLHPDETGVAYRVNGSETQNQTSSISQDNFIIHPNPALDKLTVSFDEIKDLEGISLSIYNSLGQEVTQRRCNCNFHLYFE